jgi:hypothetical protein
MKSRSACSGAAIFALAAVFACPVAAANHLTSGVEATGKAIEKETMTVAKDTGKAIGKCATTTAHGVRHAI